MKTIRKAIPVLVFMLGISLFSIFQGCAGTPEKTDTEKVRSHAEESFEELKQEENRQK